jgi:hypothetical protein
MSLRAIVKSHYVAKDSKQASVEGYVSSLVVCTDNLEFKVTFKRTDAPVIGSLIQLSHQGFTRRGLPLYPKFDGVIMMGEKETTKKRIISLQPGEAMPIESKTHPGIIYIIIMSHSGKHMYCTCPAWKYQRLNPLLRTCKHLQEVLGQIK